MNKILKNKILRNLSAAVKLQNALRLQPYPPILINLGRYGGTLRLSSLEHTLMSLRPTEKHENK